MSSTQGFWIQAKPPLERRCRAGLCFDPDGYGVAAEALTEDQIQALHDDPWLIVEAVEFSDDQAELLRAAGDLVETHPHTSSSASSPGDGAPSPGMAEVAVDNPTLLREHLAELKAAGQPRPKVADVTEAIGTKFSGAEIAEAWQALD